TFPREAHVERKRTRAYSAVSVLGLRRAFKWQGWSTVPVGLSPGKRMWREKEQELIQQFLCLGFGGPLNGKGGLRCLSSLGD
ncbi:hypothetical protein NDU88_007777, partial [Pleurodeles waltl]